MELYSIILLYAQEIVNKNNNEYNRKNITNVNEAINIIIQEIQEIRAQLYHINININSSEAIINDLEEIITHAYNEGDIIYLNILRNRVEDLIILELTLEEHPGGSTFLPECSNFINQYARNSYQQPVYLPCGLNNEPSLSIVFQEQFTNNRVESIYPSPRTDIEILDFDQDNHLPNMITSSPTSIVSNTTDHRYGEANHAIYNNDGSDLKFLGSGSNHKI
jgi:hypothetical protein